MCSKRRGPGVRRPKASAAICTFKNE
jgi:hypothetical protein